MTTILRFISWIAVLALWGCAASVFVDPSIYGRWFALIGLAFPIIVGVVIMIGVVSLIIKPRLALISLFGLLCCCGSLRDYCPINLTSPPPKGALKVISYNTMSFGNCEMDDNGKDFRLVRYLITQQPDIACLQEANVNNSEQYDRIEASMKRAGYHFKLVWFGGNRVAVMSKKPIHRAETICRSTGNGAAAFYLTPLPGCRDTVIVISAHLESMHLSPEERGNYNELVHNPEDIHSIGGKRDMLRKIASGGVERAHQIDTLAAFLDRHRDDRILLMGDFNDTPISYAHHQVCTRLTDAYRATANGIGRSFNRDAIYVRIDNIFCSSHFKPYAMMVDPSVPFSDHYPMVGYVRVKY